MFGKDITGCFENGVTAPLGGLILGILLPVLLALGIFPDIGYMVALVIAAVLNVCSMVTGDRGLIASSLMYNAGYVILSFFINSRGLILFIVISVVTLIVPYFTCDRG